MSEFAGRTIRLAFFLFPVFYIGLLFAVVVHEILGHGLAAAAVGGHFTGFEMHWDGLGYASFTWPVPYTEKADLAILMAGICATSVVGVALLTLALIVRDRLLIRMVLLVLAIHCLLEGPAYLFWNAWRPVPPGDVGRALEIVETTGIADAALLRPVFMVVGALVSVGSTVVGLALALQTIEAHLVGDRSWLLRRRLLVILLFVILPGVGGWFAFDWNQLVPGLGTLPNYVGAMSVVLTAAALYRWLPMPKTRTGNRCAWWQIAASWFVLAGVVGFVAVWGQYGLRWE